MEQSGKYCISASRIDVWNALNDADVLRSCIDGAEVVDRIDESRFMAKVTAKIGPVKAKFAADILMEDIDPPCSYVLNVSVKGGPAGFGQGRASVVLTEKEGGTVLTYEVQGNVGGKLAQIGSRLIVAAGRKFADGFFGKFSVRWN